MPYNMPEGLINNISFGPARVFMREWSATGMTSPSIDVGYISEDGVSVELSNEIRTITQGNPRLTEYTFVQAQMAQIKFTSIQWNMQAFAFAMGAGVTYYAKDGVDDDKYSDTGVASKLIFTFGGEPINKQVGIHIRHDMAVSANTVAIYGWKCQSEGGYTFNMGQDEHAFEYTFNCTRAEKSWGNKNLDRNQQLISIVRQLGDSQKVLFDADGGPGGPL